jgi:TRAP-type C4-dicarboxylate transport system substrate-binding protein
MKRTLRSLLTLTVGAFLALSVTAHPARAEIVFKLGTLAPAGSAWHNLLKEMGQKWKDASGGQVTLRIYPGGVVGNEGDMVRKMRVGQLQAAALTVVGLQEITPEPQALSVPMVIESQDELNYVLQKLGPKLEKSLADKGFSVLQWTEVGVVRFFSTKPFRTPEEAKGRKIFSWEGDPAAVEAWRAASFQPVVLSSTDVVPALQTGMIDTIASAPLYAFTARLYQKANKMIDLPWSLLVGALIVKKDAWEQVPAALRPKLIEIVKEYGNRIDAEVRRLNDDAVVQMKRQGLEVVTPTDIAAWRKVADTVNEVVRGKAVPAPIFDEVKKLSSEFRAKGH